jgi:hypothetical protein
MEFGYAQSGNLPRKNLFVGILNRNLQLCAAGKRGTGGCEEDGGESVG